MKGINPAAVRTTAAAAAGKTAVRTPRRKANDLCPAVRSAGGGVSAAPRSDRLEHTGAGGLE